MLLSFNLIVIIVLINAKSSNSEEGFSAMNDGESDKFFETSCSREFRKQSNLLHRSSLCRQPRKVLVPIVMPSRHYIPGLVHRPQSYEVERCEGICSQANHKCLPIEKDYIEVPVTMDSIFKRLASITVKIGGQKGNQEKCMIVKVEKHIRCGCSCSMTAANCSQKHRFDEERCSCFCLDNRKAITCASNNKMWDQNTCDCECSPSISKNCSTGAVFDKESCRCKEISQFIN